MSNVKTYIKNFFDEKVIPFQDWTLEAENGTTHFINNEVVIEHIKIACEEEQKAIRNVLMEIDYRNGSVNHFLKHLAQGLVNNY